MLSTQELQAYASRLSWKPDWSIEIYGGEWEGQHVRLVGPEVDSYNPRETIDLGITSAMPPMDSFEQFDRYLMWRFWRHASHEAREWFKRDGQIVFDPHAPEAHHDREAFNAYSRHSAVAGKN